MVWQHCSGPAKVDIQMWFSFCWTMEPRSTTETQWVTGTSVNIRSIYASRNSLCFSSLCDSRNAKSWVVEVHFPFFSNLQCIWGVMCTGRGKLRAICGCKPTAVGAKSKFFIWEKSQDDWSSHCQYWMFTKSLTSPHGNNLVLKIGRTIKNCQEPSSKTRTNLYNMLQMYVNAPVPKSPQYNFEWLITVYSECCDVMWAVVVI